MVDDASRWSICSCVCYVMSMWGGGVMGANWQRGSLNEVVVHASAPAASEARRPTEHGEEAPRGGDSQS